MIRLSYEFETQRQLLDFLQNQARDNGVLLPNPQAVIPASPVPVAATEPLQAPAPKRGRPPKAAAPATTATGQGSPGDAAAFPATPFATTPQPAAPVAGEAQTPPESKASAGPAAPGAPLSTDELRPLLRAVFTKNAPAATAILKQFGANRISDIKPEQSQAFAEACNKAVA